MKESRYYHPNQEEFHLGFRYQVFEEDWDSGDLIWKSKTFPESPELCSSENGKPDLVECFYQKFEDAEYCRVKYLDRDDIEELGWVRNKEDDRYYHTCFEIGDYSLYFESNEEVVITAFHPRVEEFSKVVFYGQVNNYNELKKIMSMIGIPANKEDSRQKEPLSQEVIDEIEKVW